MAGQDPAALLEPRTHGDGTTNQWQEVAMVWTRVPVPVIAALHGPVYGAGCQLALGADIRIAGPDVKMAVMEMKWGILPDMGGMVLLPKLVRDAVLRRLAEQITLKSPSAIRAAKRLIGVAQSSASLQDVLLAESREQAALIGKPHQMEVIAAQFGKRTPKFG